MPIAKPFALKQGDLVELVSPASPIEESKLSRFVDLLEGWGLRVRVGKNALASGDYLAGTDQQRAEDLNHAFSDPEVRGVLCTRGGYGAARLLPHLDFAAFAGTRKIFSGFSDITTLHLALGHEGLATLHAPMGLTFSRDREPWVAESLRAALFGDDPVSEGSPTGTTLRPGVAEGEVTGGCLCLLCDSLSTRYPLEVEGKILLIEDVDESPHRVDAMLTHLLNAGILQTASGIIIGEMTGTDDRTDTSIGGRPWLEIVRERLSGLTQPAVVGFPFGHCPNMLSLPLGVRARLDANTGSLTYLERWCD